jgi:hypothetical protein
LGCNAMFNTLERKSWCNMEFECPGSALSGSLWMTLALVVVVVGLALF